MTPRSDDGGGGPGWGVFGSIGTAVLLVIGAMVVKGLKRAAVEIAKDPGPQDQKVEPLIIDPATQESFERFINRKLAGPPGEVPPVWAAVPVGQSPLDKYRAADLPARYRGPSLPKELVAVIEPGGITDWASPLGLTAGAGKRTVLDARRLPPAGTTTRFLAGTDDGFTCYDLADGKSEMVTEVPVDGDNPLARLTIGGNRVVVWDGDVVYWVDLARPDDPEGELDGLGDPPSPYAQMELVDGDRLLVLRRADGLVRQARLNRLAVTGVTDLGPEESADDISASPDRRMLAMTSTARKTVTLLSYDGDKVMRNRLTLGVKPARAVVHPSRRFLAVVDTGNWTRVYDIDATKQIAEFQSRVPPRATEFAADGRHLIHHDGSGKVYVFRLDQMADPPAAPVKPVPPAVTKGK